MIIDIVRMLKEKGFEYTFDAYCQVSSLEPETVFELLSKIKIN